MISSVKTHAGKVRTNNEDAYYIPPKVGDFPKLFMVADGMGGHRGGEVASAMAVREVSAYINSNLSRAADSEQVKDILKNSLIETNKKILKSSNENPEWSGMGTTITLALFWNERLYIGHVGDSRAYRIRANRIEQLTRDHSLVWELMEEGRLTLDETRTHPMKNIITKALGTDESLEPDILEFDVEKDDIILLCSDGLTNMLDDDNIREIVSRVNPEEATVRLIEEANLNGGIDNITVEIIRAD